MSDGDTTGDGAPEAVLAVEIRRRRDAAGLSQTELANRVGYSREYVSRAERPKKGLASAGLVRSLDTALGAGGALIALHGSAQRERVARRQDTLPAVGHEVARPDTDLPDDGRSPRPVDVVNPDPFVLRMLDPVDALDVVEEFTRSVVERYEIEGPSLLAPEVLALRVVCRDLGQRAGRVLQRRVLRASAAQAGLLAYMSVNLDQHAHARAFGFEASLLASAAQDRDLLAWIKGTQSFAAYYRGDYRDALRHARAGLHVAGSASQKARLLSNGVARAAGKLGEPILVQRAVDEALEVSGDTGSAGLAPCIAFEPYTYARIVANAATAYLSVGRYGTVLDLTTQLDQVVTRSTSDWSRALVGLDAASALSRGADRDLDQACTVGVRALEDSRANPIASIGRRAAELADDLARHDTARRRLEQFRQALRDWESATRVGARTG